MKPAPFYTGLCLLAVILFGVSALAADADKDLRVADGVKVSLEFTLTGPDKTVVSSNVGREPMSYIHGKGQIFPALEKALAGMKAGEKKRVELLADQAYGVYDPSKKVTVERSKVPAEAKVGSMLSSRDGGPPVKVLELSEKSAVLDLNHPLAGKNVTFDVKIVNVEREPAGAQQKP
jgi:FKBP-type peptidyl-prolyl cis-trans isomerase 2